MATILDLCGWAGPSLAQEAWDHMSGQFPTFAIQGIPRGPSAGQRCVLWDYSRTALGGSDLPNVPQQIGDCVSWGMKHAVDYLACMEIIRQGDREEFHESFAPYFYAVSRVLIGKGQLGREDGSLGSWAAAGVQQYGVLRADAAGVPAYSGNLARRWGQQGPPENLIEIARPHLVRTAARVQSWEAARDALFNGYPLTIASLRGWSMRLKNDNGKSWFSGRDVWPHQMCLVGYDETGSRPGALRLNSWGPDAHGPQLDGPAGGGWQDLDDLARELESDAVECFALSQFDGFPAQDLDYLLG